MKTADQIFTQHRSERDMQIRAINMEIEKASRAITAGICAAGSAKGNGDLKACDNYLKEVRTAETRREEYRKKLEDAETPIQIEEGLAAWEERSGPLNKLIREKLGQYESDREDLADDLRELLKLYDYMLTERNKYAAPCGNPNIPQNPTLNRFDYYSILTERVLPDLGLFKKTGDMEEKEAEYFSDLVQTYDYTL